MPRPRTSDVRADGKKNAAQNGGQDYRAGNGLQRVARLGTQGRRALETDKTVQREHQPLPEAAGRHTAKVKLVRVAVQAVAQ